MRTLDKKSWAFFAIGAGVMFNKQGVPMRNNILFVLLFCVFQSGWATAQPAGMKKEDWLATFKPSEIDRQCTDSPLKRDFKGTPQECATKVEKLFDKCATSVDNVKIPDAITSYQEAVKYGSIMGECITAYYFGGEHLSLFNKAQATLSK